MDDANGDGYLSIGDVLGLLLEEFPDVTISKIRFLESQGLISPERTPSGYRKFYDDDVDLLRVILTEQRQNFLPLRVIKDRLETGEIDPTGEHLRPDEGHGEAPESADPESAGAAAADERAVLDAPASVAVPDDRMIDDRAVSSGGDDGTYVPDSSVASHPASRSRTANVAAPPADAPSSEPQLLPGVVLDRDELCAMVGMTDEELDQLEDFGVIQPQRDAAGTAIYDDDAVEIAKPACAFLRSGIDARHLRSFRTAAEREASLYEQVVTPRFRQRNPESRAEALKRLRELDALGAKLRAAMTRQALGRHFKH